MPRLGGCEGYLEGGEVLDVLVGGELEGGVLGDVYDREGDAVPWRE